MITISKATLEDLALLTDIGRRSVIQSHGHSASAQDFDTYLANKFTLEAIREELSEPENLFHLIYYKGKAAGYSKIIFNSPNPHIEFSDVTKLERLYLLEEFYGLKLGWHLFEHNIQLAKAARQSGIWLNVWKKNDRAVAFYTKAGFEVVGHALFKISEKHSNPNFVMWKKLSATTLRTY